MNKTADRGVRDVNVNATVDPSTDVRHCVGDDHAFAPTRISLNGTRNCGRRKKIARQ